jgi:hypothetical protein
MIVIAVTLDHAPSPRPCPDPIPVPPVAGTEPFRIKIKPQLPFNPDPIPDDNEPPKAEKYPLSDDTKVMFGSSEHSIPA